MNVDVTSRGPVDPKMVELTQETFADLESSVGRSLDHVHVVLREEKPSPLRSSQSLLAPGERDVIRRKVFSGCGRLGRHPARAKPLLGSDHAEGRGQRDGRAEPPLPLLPGRRTGRGAVIYLRHDGHYGLIEPEA